MQIAICLAAIATLIGLAVYDVRHRLIPNAVILPALPLAMLAGLWLPGGWRSSALGGAAAFVFFFVVALVIGKGKLGGGDVKLAALIGLLAGTGGLPAAAMTFAVASGLVVIVGLLAGLKPDSYLPIGPLLALSGAAGLLARVCAQT